MKIKTVQKTYAEVMALPRPKRKNRCARCFSGDCWCGCWRSRRC